MTLPPPSGKPTLRLYHRRCGIRVPRPFPSILSIPGASSVALAISGLPYSNLGLYKEYSLGLTLGIISGRRPILAISRGIIAFSVSIARLRPP